MINGSLNILNIIISGILIYGLFSWPGLGFVGAGLGLTISRYIGAIVGAFAYRKLIGRHLPCDICVVEEKETTTPSEQKASL